MSEQPPPIPPQAERWQCRLCGMTDNVGSYCRQCGNGRHAGSGLNLGCTIVAVIVCIGVAGLFGACGIAMIPRKSNEYDSVSWFFFAISLAITLAASAIAYFLIRNWIRRNRR